MQKYIDILKQIDEDFNRSEFFPPARKEDILRFEKTKGIKIPESYKKFLALSDGASLSGGSINLYGVNSSGFQIGYDFSEHSVPKELIIIGYKDSEHICYYPEKNIFLFYEYQDLEGIEEECISFQDFDEVLEYLADILTS
ncbi:MAG: SMI1/KNR4 family protein [Oscillospiraceae bacterium]|nr:SMI1/KNR4 family protein [Oscillospiraceae bacterium]